MKHADVPAFTAGGKRILLGHAQLCLNVKSVRRSLGFYTRLGFRRIGGDLRRNYVILQNGSWQLGLFQGHIKENLVNFRGGDIPKVCAALKRKGVNPKRGPRAYEGGCDAELVDPDGNVIYLDTTTEELLK